MWFHKLTDFIWGIYEHILWVLTGEFIFLWRANGAGVVLFRALMTSAVVFLLTIGVLEVLEPGPVGTFSPGELATHIHDKITWVGAMFAASYAALYTRFAGQWAYLAGLYNTFMATRLKTTPEEYAKAHHGFNLWRAGFIEDAEDMHLALKSTYAGVILSMLEKDEVWRCYKNGGEDAQQHLERLKKKLTRRQGRNKCTAIGVELARAGGRGKPEDLALDVKADDDLVAITVKTALAASKAAKAASDSVDLLVKRAEKAYGDLEAEKRREEERLKASAAGKPTGN